VKPKPSSGNLSAWRRPALASGMAHEFNNLMTLVFANPERGRGG
jgi:hypothetical protein